MKFYGHKNVPGWNFIKHDSSGSRNRSTNQDDSMERNILPKFFTGNAPEKWPASSLNKNIFQGRLLFNFGGVPWPKVLVMRGLTNQLHQCLVLCLSSTWTSTNGWMAENIESLKKKSRGFRTWKTIHFSTFFSWCSFLTKRRNINLNPQVLGGFHYHCFVFRVLNSATNLSLKIRDCQPFIDVHLGSWFPTQDAGSSPRMTLQFEAWESQPKPSFVGGGLDPKFGKTGWLERVFNQIFRELNDDLINGASSHVVQE